MGGLFGLIPLLSLSQFIFSLLLQLALFGEGLTLLTRRVHLR